MVPAAVRTHYNNLKVAENALDEVIRAAYRALSQTYHPDKNPGNPDAVRVMQILNDAYMVLSNPDNRQRYDRVLAEARAQPPAVDPLPQSTSAAVAPVRPQAPPNPCGKRSLLLRILCMDGRLAFFILAFCGFVWLTLDGYLNENKRYYERTAKPYQQYVPPAGTVSALEDRPVYVRPFQRPSAAPNGATWPVGAAYIPGYPMLATGGFSSITVDNSKNNAALFVKLVILDSTEATPARFCHIPAFAEFTFKGVKQGRYDVRYRDLSTGGITKTDEFTVRETKSSTGTQFDLLSLTIYKVANGNMKTAVIPESEF